MAVTEASTPNCPGMALERGNSNRPDVAWKLNLIKEPIRVEFKIGTETALEWSGMAPTARSVQHLPNCLCSCTGTALKVSSPPERTVEPH